MPLEAPVMTTFVFSRFIWLEAKCIGSGLLFWRENREGIG
jgi:hypothetical protein